jgi:hypothetical protein
MSVQGTRITTRVAVAFVSSSDLYRLPATVTVCIVAASKLHLALKFDEILLEALSVSIISCEADGPGGTSHRASLSNRCSSASAQAWEHQGSALISDSTAKPVFAGSADSAIE